MIPRVIRTSSKHAALIPKMEIAVFMMPDERVHLLNSLIEGGGWSVFVASAPDDFYKPVAHLTTEDLEKNRNFEIGRLEDFKQIAGRQLSKIYRADRVGFVSAAMPPLTSTSNALLETNFHADPSAVATAVGRAIKKVLKKSAKQGVIVRAANSESQRLAKNVYWTERARASGKVWKQAENSVVYFVPVPQD